MHLLENTTKSLNRFGNFLYGVRDTLRNFVNRSHSSPAISATSSALCSPEYLGGSKQSILHPVQSSGALRELQHLHYLPDNKLVPNVHFPGHGFEEVLTLALKVRLPGNSCLDLARNLERWLSRADVLKSPK